MFYSEKSKRIISASVVETRVSGYPLSMRFILNCEIIVLNAALEKCRIRVSPIMKLLLILGGRQLEKCVQ